MRVALVVSLLFALVVPATAAPSQGDIERRAAELKKQLAGQGFTVTTTGPFVVVGDESPAKVRSRVNFVDWVVRLIEKDYFDKQPDKVIVIWLFRNITTYKAGAKKFFDDEPTTPYGYYSSSANALVMNIGPGAGTLSHELVHPYIEANFPDAPSWFNEGLASLYEQPREREGHMWGTTNWRLPGLTAMIRKKELPPLRALLATSSDEFYGADFDAYAYARFLCQYLQDHGKLRDFYRDFAASKDTTGVTSLEKAVGKKLEDFQPEFNKWALSLRR